MRVERLDPAFDALVPADAKVEKLAQGFSWSEGPTWFRGSVVFSDVPDNIIYQWKPGETAATVFMKPSGLLNPAQDSASRARTASPWMLTAVADLPAG